MASKPPSGLPRPSGRSTPQRASSRESLSSVASSSAAGTGDWQVGDVCWVNGTKQGKIAFIGKVKFASGDWVGVELEEGTGKNNGTIDGTTYFKAPPNHGLFCRAAKLSREPAVNEEISLKAPAPVPDLSETVLAGAADTTIRGGGAADPLLTSTPTGSCADSGVVGSAEPAEIDDRVIVSGTKLGILRFLGPVDFAQGLWAGVELEQPIGKNDGAVKGKRYFTCKPNYGLFAAASKVQRAAQQDRSKFVIKHTNTSRLRSKGGGLHRSGSQESLSSLSSFTSNFSSATGLAREKARVYHCFLHLSYPSSFLFSLPRPVKSLRNSLPSLHFCTSITAYSKRMKCNPLCSQHAR